MKIAFLVNSFPVYSETFISGKAKYLIEAGHEVEIFCSRCNRDVNLGFDFTPYIRLIHPQFPSWQAIKKISTLLRDAKGDRRQLVNLLWTPNGNVFFKIAQLARRACVIERLSDKRYDIVHAHFLQGVDLFHGLRSFCNTPVLISVYGYDASILPFSETNGISRFNCRIKQADALTYSSKLLKDVTNDTTTITVPEYILYPEISDNYFTPKFRTQPHKQWRLLSIGRLHWTKGYSFALPAIRRLLNQGYDCVYHIVGEGEARQELEYAIRRLGLEKNVFLKGKIPHEQVGQELSWADILVLPSQREDFGVVLVEAQASGVPVVATDVGGPAAATLAGKTSLLVPARDPAALSKAIIKLCSDHELFNSMSVEGPINAKRFYAENIGKELVEIYEKTISQYPK